MTPAAPHLSLFAAVLAGCLPLTALAAQSASQPAVSAGPPANATPASAREREAELGLTGPVNPRLPSLILVGDSTVRNGHGAGADGLWGWGAPLAELFDPARINVVNRAIGGLSSRTYISQGHWELTLALIKPGDFVLIQFGHNDGGLSLPGTAPESDPGVARGSASATSAGQARGSLPGVDEQTIEVENPATHESELVHTFGWYLRKYVADVRARGATPILCSLVPRKIWLGNHIQRNTETYRGWTRSVAEQQHVLFVDLNEIIARRYDAMGPAAVDPLFGDPHTHTSWAGAVLNAECVVAGFRALPGHPLDRYLSAKGRAIRPYKA